MSESVGYRPVHEEDLRALGRVQGEAVRWLVAREGREPSRSNVSDEPSPLARHLLRTGRDLWWLAEADGRPVGFSAGIVRGGLWVLSSLFAHPDVHGRGIGQELLRRCFAAGRARGARVSAIVSSSHASAQSLYVRLGLVPRFPLFILRGPVGGLLALPEPSAAEEHPTARDEWERKLSDLDETVWGRRREIDHHYWLSEPSITCRALQGDAPGLLGYVYFTPDYIGPLAARTRRAQLHLLRLAGKALAEAAPEAILVRVPGVNGTVLKALLNHHFRIDHINLVMTSRPFGHFDRYLPSGGVLLKGCPRLRSSFTIVAWLPWAACSEVPVWRERRAIRSIEA